MSHLGGVETNVLDSRDHLWRFGDHLQRFWVAVLALIRLPEPDGDAEGVAATFTVFAPFHGVPTTTCRCGPSDATAFSFAPGMAAFRVLAESSRPGPYWMTVVVTPC